MSQRMLRASFLLVVLVAGSLLAAACTQGISQGEYDGVKQQLAAKESEFTEAQGKLIAAQKEATDLKAAAGKVTMLTGAQLLPTPTPAPTSTPLPAGATPPPPPARPAYLTERVPFTYYVETLATTRISKYGVAATVNCLNTNVFKRGQRLVWRFEVFDTSTGKRVTNNEGTVKVKLPHGEEMTSGFSMRGGVGPWMWTSNWDIPPDYPLGGLDYEIIVTTKEGAIGSFKQPALVRAATATAAALDTKLQIVQ